MHMISKKDLNDAEMDTLTKSCSPTVVITASGEVQTHEVARVYVKELDIFLTMKVLEDTPAVLSLGKLCDEHGYSYEWINGHKPHLVKKRDSDSLQHGELRSDCGSRLVIEFFIQFSSFNLNDTFKTESSFYIYLKLVFSNYDSIKRQEDSRQRIKLKVIPLQCLCQLRLMIERGNPLWTKPTKNFQKQIKRNPRGNRATRFFLKSWSGCKNSEKISWMTAFLNIETHTPVLLMKYLWSPHSRDARSWVSTVFVFTSRKTEIARSVRGPKLQRLHAEDAMAEPHLVQKILVT